MYVEKLVVQRDSDRGETETEEREKQKRDTNRREREGETDKEGETKQKRERKKGERDRNRRERERQKQRRDRNRRERQKQRRDRNRRERQKQRRDRNKGETETEERRKQSRERDKRIMADIHHSFLGLLLTVLYLPTGVSGGTLSKASRVGGDVSLPCNNVVYPNCSSTTWNFNRAGSNVTIEVLKFGTFPVQKTERAGRLSLGSDCSLHVSDVRAEDAGLYTCQQILRNGGEKQGDDANVHLSVLTDSSDVTTLIPVTTTTWTPQQYETGTCNAVKFPISHIMLFVGLTIMAAIVTIHTTRRNRPLKALHPQAEEASGIEFQVQKE